jgi:alpha-1,4-digalacturonate transport system permease protein
MDGGPEEARLQMQTPAAALDRRDRTNDVETWRELGVGAKSLMYAVLALLSLVMLFPFVWMISTALRPAGYESVQTLVPQSYLAFENFGKAWNYRGTFFTLWLTNSVIISIVATGLATGLNALSGFAFAKYTFAGREFLFGLVLATMMVPFQVIMIPVYVVITYGGLSNNLWGVILPSTASAFGIFLMRQFMQSIPDELMDAARIDGASEFRIFWQLVLPLSMPAVAAFATLHFLYTWNNYLLPLLVLTRRQLYTLQTGIDSFKGEYRADYSLMMAMSIITIIPPVVIFIFFQRFFVRGIAMTGMKG